MEGQYNLQLRAKSGKKQTSDLPSRAREKMNSWPNLSMEEGTQEGANTPLVKGLVKKILKTKESGQK